MWFWPHPEIGTAWRGLASLRVSAGVSSGLFALGGALIGALASGVVTVGEWRQRKQDREAERLDRLNETRRTLYSSLLERSDVLVDCARDAWNNDCSEEVEDEVENRYLTAWASFVEARASVEVVGPPEAVTAARQMSSAVASIVNQVDGWLYANEPWTDDAEAEREQLLETRLSARDSFARTAQSIVTGSKVKSVSST